MGRSPNDPDGSNGKSTFLAVIQSLLGEENIASLDLKELGDRFKTAEMVGKLANIGFSRIRFSPEMPRFIRYSITSA